MLGVVDHLFAVALEIRNGLGNEGEVLYLGDAQGALGMEVPALAKDRNNGRRSLD
jgi:hypothetical protein